MNDKKVNVKFLSGWGFNASIWPHHYSVDPSDKFILIGWSLGGLYAINLAYRFPEKVKKLIFITSLPKFVSKRESDWQGIPEKHAIDFTQCARTQLSQLINHFVNLVQYPSRKIGLRHELKKHMININDDKNRSYLQRSLNFLFQTDYREQYRKLSQPIVHIWGSHDAIIPLSATQQIPHKNHIISGAGHVPFLTHTEHFSQILHHEIYEKS